MLTSASQKYEWKTITVRLTNNSLPLGPRKSEICNFTLKVNISPQYFLDFF